MELTKDQAKTCAGIIQGYFNQFGDISDYIRIQKLDSLSNRASALPGMGPEEDLFSDFSVSPQDMNFEIVELDQNQWDMYLNMISSHSNMTSIPGKCLRLAILETTTNKWVGFIRLGSPVINMKPRNILLEGYFTQSEEFAKSFNNTSVMGFVIVPAQPFGFNYLGGKLLAAICCSHWVRERLDEKYGMNTCFFETTSLYGTSKSSSQYDGMKPYLRFRGLTESSFVPMIHGDTYDILISYVEDIVGDIVEKDASSRKLKQTTKIIAMVRAALDGNEKDIFNLFINKALKMTEKKRYYSCNYGFTNYKEVVRGEQINRIADDEQFPKFELENIIEWWKIKATKRYESLKADGRLRKEQEVWTDPNKTIDIIR
jgi:hypothetical protein